MFKINITYFHLFFCFLWEHSKYLLQPNDNSIFPTPSPSDVTMGSPNSLNCMNLCNNNIFVRQSYDKRMSVDVMDSFTKTNTTNYQRCHPGQAVKIITESTGDHKVICNKVPGDKEVCREDVDALKESRSFTHFNAIETPGRLKRTNTELKEYKSCDENLIKFIFTKHGIEVISDVETIV